MLELVAWLLQIELLWPVAAAELAVIAGNVLLAVAMVVAV